MAVIDINWWVFFAIIGAGAAAVAVLTCLLVPVAQRVAASAPRSRQTARVEGRLPRPRQPGVVSDEEPGRRVRVPPSR